MSSQLRKCIAKRIFEAVDKGTHDPVQIQNKISARLALNLSKENHITLRLRVRELPTVLGINASTLSTLAEKLQPNQFSDSNAIESVSHDKQGFNFTLNRSQFVKDTIENVLDKRSYKLIDVPRENILVEYSSPNIAKPFHMGHLRSTMIGNTVANILAAYDHNVTRINYLGDWGTQFGFLKLGMDMKNFSSDQLAKEPIQCLYEAYVHANQAAENDQSISERAREIFNQMECDGSLNSLDSWNSYREHTVKELERVYARLNVVFDEYAWESDYRKARILPHLERIKESGCTETDADGLVSFVHETGDKWPILKSDGSTLYLTRDIAAIIERQKKYEFDRMYYVVGAEQKKHFEALFAIARKMGIRNADRLQHIRFGRLQHMSTRKGTAVFLDDILNEARDLHHAKQLESKFTKIDVEADGKKTADMLGISAIIAFELNRKAKSSYEFSMEKVMEYADEVGGELQLAHCRLCSLQRENSTIIPATECDPNLLLEPAAIRLAYVIGKFPEMLCDAQRTLDGNLIYVYSIQLSKSMKSAIRALKVKYEPDPSRQAQRMLLFESSRKVLAYCLKLISLTPLEKV